MEIDHHNEENIEAIEFIKFSIREYVAEIRKKDPKKCWPFGSLGDPDNIEFISSYQSSKSTFLSSQNFAGDINDSNTPEHTDAPNSSKVEISNGKEDLPETTTDMIESLGIDSNVGNVVYNGSSELIPTKVNNGQCENSVNEGAKIGHNVAAENNEPQRNQSRRKSQKFRLLSDIYKDPASKLRARHDINPENVNRRFVTEFEDDSEDDITLGAYFRKRKGVEITDSTLKKKRKIIEVEKSKPGSKDSIGNDSNVGQTRKKPRIDDMNTQIMAKHQKGIRLQYSQIINRFAEVCSTEATEKENEDSEMEAVMLLARHFNEEKQILSQLETNTTCACVKKKVREHSTPFVNKSITKTSFKTAAKDRVVYADKHKKITKEKLENPFCSVQRRSFIPMKATSGSVFQGHMEICITKAAGVVPDAQNRVTLVCSVSRNPADFSIPNAGNKFMRGG